VHAVRGLASAAGPPRVSVGQAILSAVSLVAVVGFVVRRSPVGPLRVAHAMAALPSLALAACLPLVVPSPEAWPPATLGFVFAGSALACWALGSLGASFGVLPARRDLVTRGPYRLVRHPAYLGELLVLTGLSLPLGWVRGGLLIAAGLATFVLRIRAEEAVLQADPGYAAYALRVRGRLLPRWR
jgi:protein-S-isoprenylcysteine O-methyltransferase Ste14